MRAPDRHRTIARRWTRPWAWALLELVIILTASQSAAARTWQVLPDGSGDAPTIQAAVDSAASGDEIAIAAGEYRETINVVRKSLRIIGSGSESCTITTAGFGVAAPPRVSNFWVVVEGLHFKAAYEGVGTGIGHQADAVVRDCIFEGFYWGTLMAANARLTVDSVTFRDNHGSDHPGGGLAIDRGTSVPHMTVLVENCVFERNSVTNADFGADTGGGLYVESGAFSDDVEIRNNLFIDNEGPNGSALFIGYNGDGFRVHHNTFVGNRKSPAMVMNAGGEVYANIFAFNESSGLFFGGDTGYCSCNLFWGNAGSWGGSCEGSLAYDVYLDPLFCHRRLGNYSLAAQSPALPANHPPELQKLGICTDMTIGAFGVGCDEVPIVQESWGKIKQRFR